MSVNQITREQCDAARDAAQDCRISRWFAEEWILRRAPEEMTVEKLREIEARLKQSILNFPLAWTSPVRSHFYLNLPDASVRFGVHLTACELAFERCGTALCAIRMIANLNPKAGIQMLAFKFEGDGSEFDASGTNIDIEWIAAVRALAEGSIKDAAAMPIEAPGYLNIVLRALTSSVTRTGRSALPIPLSPQQFRLCELFVKNGTRGVNLEQLKELDFASDEARRTAIHALRQCVRDSLGLNITGGKSKPFILVEISNVSKNSR